MNMLWDAEHYCVHCARKVEHVHHCNPVEESKFYTCKFCGTENVNHRHMCKVKLENMHFFCKNCGIVSETEFEICNPIPIDDEQRAIWKDVAKNSPNEVILSCGVCGQPVDPPGHPCDPKFPYTCSYCGEYIESGYHYCQKKVGKCRYDCKTCGRIGVKSQEICAPVEFRSENE